MRERIALFANRGSPQVAEIAAAVTEAGGTPLALDLRVGGAVTESDQPAVSFSSEKDCWAGEDFSTIRAIHVRCTTPRTLPTLPPVLTPLTHAEYRHQFLREQTYQAVTYGFLEHQAAQGKLVINRLTSAYLDHNAKSQFYEKLRAAGFRAPRSLSTNCPVAAARFLGEVGEAVIKPMIGIGSTRVVEGDDRSRLDELPRCPALFQERISGPTLRIHVVADSMVLAARILAEGVDSRTGHQEFERIDLPEEECAAIVRVNRFLGLHYAAWDAIQDDSGRLCYLDCNPGPFVMWLPPAWRHHIFSALARSLVTFAQTGSLEAASAAVPREIDPAAPLRTGS